MAARDRLLARLKGELVRPGSDAAGRLEAASGSKIATEVRLIDFLKRPEATIDQVIGVLGETDADPELLRGMETEVKYEGYVKRQDAEIARIRRNENIASAGRFGLSIDPGAVHGAASQAGGNPAGNPGPGSAHPGHDPRRTVGAPGSRDQGQRGEKARRLSLNRRCSSVWGCRLTGTRLQALGSYSALVARWNRSARLVSGDDLHRFSDRHLLDSLVLAPLIRKREGLDNDTEAGSGTDAGASLPVADFGSGGGLPGIPLAIALPTLTFTLIDRSEKKARFLRRVRDELKLANVGCSARMSGTCSARVTGPWSPGQRCRCRRCGNTRGRRWRRGDICWYWTG